MREEKLKGKGTDIEKLGERSGRICQNWKKAESINLETMSLHDNVWEKKVSYINSNDKIERIDVLAPLMNSYTHCVLLKLIL